MRNFTLQKLRIVVLLGVLLSSLATLAQDAVPFAPRLPGGSMKVKGDVMFVGNHILNRSNLPGTPSEGPNAKNNNMDIDNNSQYMDYINVDNDPSTWSSSSADLAWPAIPGSTPGTTPCFRVAYAGLYWAAIYPYELSLTPGQPWVPEPTTPQRNNDWNQVKFKIPGGSYINIEADNAADPAGDEDAIIFNGFGWNNGNPNGQLTSSFKDSPYICYKNVTGLLQSLNGPQGAAGTYFVANMRAARGRRDGGSSAGWVLVVIYESTSPNVTSKFISVFDGYTGVKSGVNSAPININGFTTLPAPYAVKARLGIAALEGDLKTTQDGLGFKANSTPGTTPVALSTQDNNPATNFFNSSITRDDIKVLNRNPASENTLGFDLDMFEISNPTKNGQKNSVIPNGETGAKLTLTTNGDGYGAFLATFAVDIIEPNIKLTKRVLNGLNQDISGQDIGMDKELTYEITYENVGNDNATNLVIRDVLPKNTTYAGMVEPIPANVNVNSSVPGVLTFTNIDNTKIVKPNNTPNTGATTTIKFKVKTAATCNELTDHCDNLIMNQAFATYKGVENTNQITDDPSVSSFVCTAVPGPTNMLIGVTNCVYKRTEILCGPSMTLTAGSGYATYQWFKVDPAGNIPLGTTQSITISDAGDYLVKTTSNTPPCIGIDELVTVNLSSNLPPNPLIAVDDQTVQCPNNGKWISKIFLCGNNAQRLLSAGAIAGTATWYKLNTTTCTTVVPDNCPHDGCPASSWLLQHTGTNYTVTTDGEFKLVINNNGCIAEYYFKVTKNLLNYTLDKKDMLCTTNGEIKISGVGAGYEYRFSNQTTGAVLQGYSASSTYTVTTPGVYKVEIRETGVTTSCTFIEENIGIQRAELDLLVSTTDKTCTVLNPTIKIEPQGLQFAVPDQQYKYTITGPVTLTSAWIPNEDPYIFQAPPGTYTVTGISTGGVCTKSYTVTIYDYSNPTAIASVQESISCYPGVIRIVASGGKAPYNFASYSKNGTVITPAEIDFSDGIYSVPVGGEGTYVFIVQDANGCETYSNPITINNIVPVVTQSSVNPICSTGNTGSITVSATGTGINYELVSGGVTISGPKASGSFPNLAAGNYIVNVIQRTPTDSICTYPRNFVLTAPAAISANANIITQYTCITGGATIEATGVTGGTGAYEYSINGTTFGSSPTFSGLGAGTYAVTVKDANGCTFTTPTMTVTAPAPVTGFTITGTALTCPSETSTVTLSAVVGGAGPFTYAITAPAGLAVNNGSSPVFAGLAPGNYTFTVTDSKGCTYPKNHLISPITPIAIVGVRDNHARCHGSNTGAATYTVSGFGTSYNYTITSTGTPVTPATVTGYASDTISLTGLGAGDYTITVTNTTTNCTASATVAIANPTAALAVTNTPVQPTCTTLTGGVTINATGGWGGYSYSLAGPTPMSAQAQDTFTGLAPGLYTATVTDANGCIQTTAFTISAATAPVLAVTGSDLCIDATPTSITVAVTSGGLAPFQFSLNGGPYQNGTVANGTTYTNLAAGIYTITVKDANNCTNATAVTRTINTQLTATASITKGLTCNPPPAAAQISVSIGGGNGPYNYEVKIGVAAFTASAAVGSSVLTYSAAAAGDYQFRITDAAGCTVTTPVMTVAPITPPSFTLTPTHVLCFGSNTGAIAVNINTAFGTGPYTIAVNKTNAPTASFGAQTAGLPAGNYTVTVTDSKGCPTSVTTVINTNTAVTANITDDPIQCVPDADPMTPSVTAGSITVNSASGGQGPYTYKVTNNFGYLETFTTPGTTGVSNAFTILSFGIYYVEVKDANGCTYTQTVVMASPPGDLTLTATPGPTTCTAGGTVSVTVGAWVSSGNYEFGILETPTAPYTTNYFPPSSGTDTKLFDASVPGVFLVPGVFYTFVVHDITTDCYSFATIQIPDTAPITLTAAITPHNVTCPITLPAAPGTGDGSVSFTLSNYVATSISYQIFNAQSNTPIGTPVTFTPGPLPVENVGALNPGEYYILFTELNGTYTGCTKVSLPFTISQSAATLIAGATVIKNDNCNPLAGIISASAQFGTGPYSYQLELQSATAPTVATWAGQASPVFNADGGNYTVYVKDANNCIKDFDIILDTDVSPGVSAVLAPGTQCTTAEGNFTINVTRTLNTAVGPFLYSIDGGAFQPQGDTFPVSGLASGVHTVQIMDVNGCTAPAAASVTIHVPISVTAQPTVQPTCGNGNLGTITAVGLGGSAPANLRYELQTAAGAAVRPQQTSGVFTLVAAGNYKVVIHDTATPCTAEALVSLDATVPVTFSTNKNDVSCNGGTNGSISINLPASNTDISYSYSIQGTSGGPITQSTPAFTGLAADTYTVTVTSGKGCSATASVAIAQPSAVGVTASVTTAFTCAANNSVNTATVTAVGSGGTPPYTYSIDGGASYSTTPTFAIASTGGPQTKTVHIKDDKGCSTSVNVNINPLPVLGTPTAIVTTAIECDDNQGVITVTAAGGSGNFTFKMEPSGTPVNTAAGDYDHTFTITEPGIYTFTITDDVTGCHTTVTAAEVLEYDLIAVSATASTPVACFGSSTGSVTIDVDTTKYTGPYSYTVFNGATSVVTATGNTSVNPLTITGLPAGNLFVRVTATASPFCDADSNAITVGSPADPLALTAAMTFDPTCTDNLGEITAEATGGWGSYEYELVNTTTSVTTPYSTNNVFSGLAAGTYTVNVKDLRNCIVSQTNVVLPVSAPITATAGPLSTALQCNGDTTATVTATASGGQGTYEYVLNTYDATGATIVSSTGAVTNNVFANLGAGIYSVTVTDGWSCGPIETNQVEITQPDPLAGYLSMPTGLTCTTGALLVISGTGGTPPYMYSLDNGATYVSPNAAGGTYEITTPVNGAGTYSYYVRDAAGCTAVMTNEIIVPAVPALVITLDLDAAYISCTGNNNALVNAQATGGLGNYVYTLRNNDNGTTTTNATGVFPGLGAGHYQVSVVSGDCSTTSPTIINITEPIPFNPDIVVTNVLCFEIPTGKIEITTTPLTKGTGSIQYAISPNLSEFFNTPVFDNLQAGPYTVIAQDSNGCYETFNVTITQPDQIAAHITIHSDERCLGSADGTIDIEVEGGNPPYAYSTVDGGLGAYTTFTGTTHTITGLPVGITKVYVKDANGCSINPEMQQEIKAGVSMDPQVTVTPTCVANAPNNNVTIGVTLTGNPAGNLSYITYSIDGTNYQASNVFNNVNLGAGTHTAYAKHTMPGTAPVVDRECIQTKTFSIVAHNAIAATAAVKTPIACYGGTGAIEITVTSSTGTLEYAIGPAYTFGSSNVFSGLTASATGYDFKVRDALGCEFTITGVVLTQPTALTATVTGKTDEICAGDDDGEFTVTPSGGTTDYVISIDGGVTYTATATSAPVTFDNLEPGIYTVVIKDANNCTYTVPATVTIAAGVDIEPSAQVYPTCINNVIGNYGFIQDDNANTDLVYSLDGGPYDAANNYFENIASGPHTMSIRHLNGCVQTRTFNVAPLTAITGAAVTSQTNVLCHGDSTGAVTVTATGGTGTLSYAIHLDVASPTFTSYQPTGVFNGLAAGNYVVSILDDNVGCETRVTFTITQPTGPLTATIGSQTNVLCHGDATGVATVSVTGGTGVYSYSWNTTPVQNTASITGLIAGTYIVTVTDANSCTTTQSFTITQPTDPLTATIGSQTNVLCHGNATGAATVNVSGGTGVYSYSWNTTPVQTTATATNLIAGTYIVTVTDAKSCTTTQSFTITQPTGPLTATIGSQTNVLCHGNATGVATVSVTGGTGVYSYSWNTTPVQTTASITGLTAGTYTVTVTDANSCTTTQSFTITQPAGPLTATIGSQTNVLCHGNATGVATVSVTGGTGVYSYSWNTTPVQTTATATNLTAGTYTVTVTDANSCTTTQSFTITQPTAPLTATTGTTQTNVLCFGNATGSATIVPTGGTGIYSYSWNTTPVQTTATATNLIAGTYTVTVTDANSCTITQSFTITQPTGPLTATIGSQTNVLCHGNATGAATVNVTGGTGVYTYSWNTTPVQTTATATGLVAGTYIVTVTDANGCTTTQSFTITQPTGPLTATIASQTNVLCHGDATGVAAVSVTGGTGAYNYSWNTTPVQTTAAITGLTAGTYIVTVTDANGCTTTQSFTITQPTDPLTAIVGSQTNVLCHGDATGVATVNVTGGTGVYSYSWDTTPVQTTATITGLTAGTYTVTVTDANSCTTTQAFTITQPTGPLTATVGSQTNVLCHGNATGAATVSVTGGTGVYSYSWNTTPVQTTATATGLTAGTYTVTVTDANGCTATQPFTITQPTAPLTATIGSQTNVLCHGNATGAAAVSVTGGAGTYTYSWNTTPVQTTATATGLTAGTYTVTVTDANGCTSTQAFTITQPTGPLTATIGSQTNVLCHGNATGAATVNVTGGTGAYTYSWNTTPVQTTASITGLTAGTYIVTVTDANSCTTTQSFTITQPAAPLSAAAATTQTNVLCFGNATGSATIVATGGTGVYTYSWNTTPVQTTATATGLTAGTYTVTVTDANGCNISQSFTITQPASALTAAAGIQTNVLCFGAATGAATVNVTGGAGTYTYSWNTTPVQTTATATGLTAGTYTVTVTDANGCTSTQAFTITQPTGPLTATIGSQTNVLCHGNATGAATVNVTGGTGAYTYSWNTTPVQTTAAITGLTAGTYIVTVTDANSCTTTQSFTITQPVAPLSAAAATTQTNVLCFGNATGSATIVPTGGTLPYAYSWNTTPVQTTATATGLTAGTYTVTVTDANGCNISQSFTITQPASALTAAAGIQTNVLCFGAATGSATIVATGGSPAYTYTWNTTPVQTTATATGLTAGNYQATVTDANGCTAIATFTISQPATAMTATVAHTDESCLNDSNGTITVTPSGGTAPYQASINGGAFTPVVPSTGPIVFSGLTGGNFTIQVRDANGCIFNAGTTTVLTGIVINPTVTTTQQCEKVTVVVGVNAGVVGQVTYSLDGGTPQASNTFPDVVLNPAVPHTVTVVHVQGCSQTTTPFTINAVAPIIVNASTVVVTNIACHGEDVGSIVVNATGGTGPLQYAITWGIWPTPLYGPSNTFNALLANTNEGYTVHVKDAMGCVQSYGPIFITEPAQELLITAAVGQHESCAGAHDGSINITMVQGGTPPYYIALDSPMNFQPYDPAATPDFAGLYGRSMPYEIYVRDASGCYAKAVVTIDKGVNLVPNIQTVLSCVNNVPVNTVTATLNANISNVEYKLETAAGALIQNFSTVHTWTLDPGNYVYTVRHINGCQKTFPFTVHPRVPITVASVLPTDAACNGGTDGTLTVTATGGSGNLQYGISPDYVMSPNPVFTGLAAGTYIVRVQDQFGCYVDFTNFPAIGEPAVIAVADLMNLPEACIEDNDGAFEIDITGGTAPYATSLDANGPFVQDQTLFDGLDGGTYTVYIQDANGCTMTHDVTLTSPLDIDARAEIVDNCGQITVTIVTNGAINPAELNYSITGPKDGNNPPQVSNVFANLEDGTYTVEVVNTVTGCTDNVTFPVTSYPDLALSLSMSGLNQFTATVMGGKGPYQYTLNGDSNGSKNVFTYFESGRYEVTVTDSRGCQQKAFIDADFVDIILPDVISPDGDGQNDTWSPGNTTNYPNINSDIFDRYGRKLATLRQGDTWDGTYDGNPMPTGDYWFLVRLGDADDRNFVGHFTIYR